MTEEKTFKEQAIEAIANHAVRAVNLEFDDGAPAFTRGYDYICSSELDAHEGPFFSSSELQESVHRFNERALYSLFNMKSDEEIAQMSEYDRLYYLGTLAAYSDILSDYIKDYDDGCERYASEFEEKAEREALAKEYEEASDRVFRIREQFECAMGDYVLEDCLGAMRKEAWRLKDYAEDIENGTTKIPEEFKNDGRYDSLESIVEKFCESIKALKTLLYLE